MEINQFSPLEYKFTELLGSIALKPKTLYCYGKPARLADFAGSRAIAIVGARKSTPYGEKVAYEAAYTLARQGIIIISGLAYGIDSVAHRAALDAGGKTIAILGTPIDRIYPKAHLALARKIVSSGGLIFSEYGPQEKFLSKISFLMRNRLISGLADAVLVAEAGIKSGTLNTATHAIEQGKDLWVVPGDIDRPGSLGCNKLLAQGANPYTGIDDLLAHFNLKTDPKALKYDSPAEQAIGELLSSGVRDGEEIVSKTNLSPAEFSSTITLMEIKGLVKSLGCNKWLPLA